MILFLFDLSLRIIGVAIKVSPTLPAFNHSGYSKNLWEEDNGLLVD
jgi:hypothetical protein